MIQPGALTNFSAEELFNLLRTYGNRSAEPQRHIIRRRLFIGLVKTGLMRETHSAGFTYYELTDLGIEAITERLNMPL